MARKKVNLDLRKKAPIKKKTYQGQGARSKFGTAPRGQYPPAGGRRYRKRNRGQGRSR